MTLNAEELFERFPDTHLPESHLDLLLKELECVEREEAGFCQRVLRAAQAGKLTGQGIVVGEECGCAYGQGAGLDEAYASDLMYEMRQEIHETPDEYTPLERIIEYVYAGDTADSNDDLAFLEEVLLHFLTNKGKEEGGVAC